MDSAMRFVTSTSSLGVHQAHLSIKDTLTKRKSISSCFVFQIYQTAIIAPFSLQLLPPPISSSHKSSLYTVADTKNTMYTQVVKKTDAHCIPSLKSQNQNRADNSTHQAHTKLGTSADSNRRSSHRHDTRGRRIDLRVARPRSGVLGRLGGPRARRSRPGALGPRARRRRTGALRGGTRTTGSRPRTLRGRTRATRSRPRAASRLGLPSGRGLLLGLPVVSDGAHGRGDGDHIGRHVAVGAVRHGRGA